MASLPECFDEATHNRDYMVEIMRVPETPDTENVVYWCKKCGGVVVDNEGDGRIYNHIRKLEFPEILSKV